MDLYRTISELKHELRRIEKTIARLEKVSPIPPAQCSTRGRKNMLPEERLKVSERMKAYWARRRGSPSQSHQKNTITSHE